MLLLATVVDHDEAAASTASGMVCILVMDKRSLSHTRQEPVYQFLNGFDWPEGKEMHGTHLKKCTEVFLD